VAGSARNGSTAPRPANARLSPRLAPTPTTSQGSEDPAPQTPSRSVRGVFLAGIYVSGRDLTPPAAIKPLPETWIPTRRRASGFVQVVLDLPGRDLGREVVGLDPPAVDRRDTTAVGCRRCRLAPSSASRASKAPSRSRGSCPTCIALARAESKPMSSVKGSRGRRRRRGPLAPIPQVGLSQPELDAGRSRPNCPFRQPVRVEIEPKYPPKT
jgi:hypothetical protein